MNNFMNAEFGGPGSSAIAHNSKFELTDIIDAERPIDLLSDQEVEKLNKTQDGFHKYRTNQP